MIKDNFSNHIGGASELTVIAAIKPGFVPCRTLISYSARMRIHLRMLSQLRRIGLEGRRAGVYVGPLDALRTLQYIRWTLIDNDTRMLLAVNFDRPLEPYLRRIVDIGGPLLDTILCHCEGFEEHSSDQGFHKFMQFAATHQAPVELFAATAPDFTVDDVDYFVSADRELRKRGDTAYQPNGAPAPADVQAALDDRNPDTILAAQTVERPLEKLRKSQLTNPLALLDQGLNIIQVVYDNAHFFAENNDPAVRDDLLYYRLVETLTPNFWTSLYYRFTASATSKDPVPVGISSIPDPYNMSGPQLERFHAEIRGVYSSDLSALPPELQKLAPLLTLLRRYDEALSWYARRPKPRETVALTTPTFDPDDIQRDLLKKSPALATSGNQHVAACMMLMRVDDAQLGQAFLTNMEQEIWNEDEVRRHCGLSITYAGLKALEIDEKTLASFPAAFREGMALRAGMLGDVDVNNPQEWVWPTSKFVSSNGVVREGRGSAISPDTIDIIVQLAAEHDREVSEFTSQHPLFEDVKRIAGLAGAGVSLIGVEAMQRNLNGSSGKMVGHLGFQDGISQPQFRGLREGDNGDYAVRNPERFVPDTVSGGMAEELQKDFTLMGDLLIGHPAKADLDLSINQTDREKDENIKPYPRYTDSPLKDGTFQVIRKLRINSEEFEFRDHPKPVGDAPTIQERMIGRKKSGGALAPGVAAGAPNNFNYDDDKVGKITPLQSHIRRTNPREADTPRILRRGYTYGPSDDPKADRGLMFIAYNANIAEQFEVIQRWVSGGNSTRISSYHGDPLLAPGRPDGGRSFLSLDANGAVERISDMPTKPPVILQWGIYAFTPSRRGLRKLAENAEGAAAKTAIKATARITSLPDDETKAEWSVADWRRALEDIDDERRDETLKLWADIRGEAGGVFDTQAYGVLVGGEKGVREVLQNANNAFSTREYCRRMHDSSGKFYLGFDDPPIDTQSTDQEDKAFNATYRSWVKDNDYKSESAPANDFMARKPETECYEEAFEKARILIADLPDDRRFVPDHDKPTGDIDLPAGKRVLAERFFNDLVAELCVDWMGLPKDAGVAIGGPEGDALPHCPVDLVRASFYVFWPHPTAEMAEKSRAQTTALRKAVRTYVASGQTAPEGTLLHALLENWPNANAERLERISDTVVSVCSGFAGPTGGSFRSVMFDWIKTGQFWRLQQQVQAFGAEPSITDIRGVLESSILNSMSKRAAPDVLHREVVKNDVTIDGKPVEAGKRVVISLRSAIEGKKETAGAVSAADQRYFLFGGDYHRPGKPTHSCPGQRMAMGAMMGAFAALMAAGDVRPEGPLSFRIHPPN